MDNKKLAIIILAIVAFILALMFVWVIFLNNALQEKIKSQNTVTPTATVTATATIQSKTDEELIREALIEKLSLDPAAITVSIGKKSESAVFGSVGATNEPGGGWFVAVKENGAWIIIDSGNGTIDCALMDQYSVPNTVVEECYDGALGKSVTR